MRVIFLILLSVLFAGCAQSSPWGMQVKEVDVEALKPFAPIGRLSGVAKPVAYRLDLDLDPRQSSFRWIC